jgi:hypothetical protein
MLNRNDTQTKEITRLLRSVQQGVLRILLVLPSITEPNSKGEALEVVARKRGNVGVTFLMNAQKLFLPIIRIVAAGSTTSTRLIDA